MSALGHYLEDEGIATTAISLVREHAEAMRPPRALWVPFMLGRPMGVPDDPDFQREVLRAVLKLLEAETGPVLQDFPREAPAVAAEEETQDGDACPVNFGRPPGTHASAHVLAGALHEEIAQLRPWHDLAARRRGGSNVGLAAPSPEAAAQVLLAFLSPGATRDGDTERPSAEALKFACDDLRAFYEEAATAQPGKRSPAALERWFYLQTVAGEVLAAVHREALASDEPSVRFVAERVLLPRSILHRRDG